MALEIVDLPINNGDLIFHSYLSLPEGIKNNQWFIPVNDDGYYNGNMIVVNDDW